MKLNVLTFALAVLFGSLVGCGTNSQPTVNPAPEMTDEQFLEMDEESDRAREEAIRDGQ